MEYGNEFRVRAGWRGTCPPVEGGGRGEGGFRYRAVCPSREELARTPVDSCTQSLGDLPGWLRGGSGGDRTEKSRRPFRACGGGWMTTKRSWSEEEELRVVLEGLHPNANVEAIDRAPGIPSSQLSTWRAAALQGVKAGLAHHQGPVTQHQRPEIARLKRPIADQAVASGLQGRVDRLVRGKERRRELVMTLRAHDIATAQAGRRAGFIDRHPTRYYPRIDSSARRPRADELLVRRGSRTIAVRHGTHGIRRVTAVACHAGLTINRERVRRILASEGLLWPAHLPRPRLPPTGRPRPSSRTDGSTPTPPTSTRPTEALVRGSRSLTAARAK